MVGKGRRLVRSGKAEPAGADPWAQKAGNWLARYDALVTPVVARSPGRAGALTDRGYLATYLASARAVPFCQPWNLAGFPAITVPVGVRDGLPLVVQVVGRPGAEALLLGLAGQLEQPIAP
jgi:amidase